MPDEEAAARGRQSHRDIDPAGHRSQPHARISPHWTHPEGGRDPSDYLEHLRKGSSQPAPGSLEEDAAHLEAFRSYHSGFSNDARSTGEESAPPNAEFEYPDDGTGIDPKGKTRRTPRQQEQNKHAQQRYRAKRKAHFDELRGTVNGLVAELQASERERRALETEIMALRRLQGPVGPGAGQASAAASGSESVQALVQALLARGVLPSHAASLKAPSLLPQPTPPRPPPLPPPVLTAVPSPPDTAAANPGGMPTFSPETIHQMLGAFKKELWAFLTANNLFLPAHFPVTSSIPLATSVPSELLPQVIDLIKMGIELSKQVIHVSGPDSQLVLHDGAPTTHPCAADESIRWQEVVLVVAPTPEQAVQIVSLRKSIIMTLQTSYTARIELKTAGFQSLGTNPDTGTHRWAEEILLHAAANAGYSLLAQANSELFHCVEKLKHCVDQDREQIGSALSQVLLNILTPLQAVKYFAKSHPFSWNVLAFLNVVAAGCAG
ncbi:hypothetical protein NADE_007228 [Nannochloris sp. 'desiccata']|nr:hypothetical protein NADE_007228 [Chlorella desiccata (nom. nud.)]